MTTTAATSFRCSDLFGDPVELSADWAERPLLLGLLRDFVSPSSLAIGGSLVRPDDEINANAYAVRVLALDENADVMSFMAESGCNSPVGRIALEAVPRETYAVVDVDGRARDAVFVIDGGDVVFAKAPATPDDFTQALDIIRARVPGRMSPAPNTILDDLRAAIASFDPETGLPADPDALGPLVHRAMQTMASPRIEDKALLPELGPLLDELTAKIERVVGPIDEGSDEA